MDQKNSWEPLEWVLFISKKIPAISQAIFGKFSTNGCYGVDLTKVQNRILMHLKDLK